MKSNATEKYTVEGRLISGPPALRKLYDIFDYYRGKTSLDIFLDFSELNWIDANLCAILDSIIFVLNRDWGHRFYIDKKDINGKFEIFQRNGFLKPSENGEVLIDNRETTVKLTRFLTDSDGEFYGYIGDSLFGHKAFEDMPEVKANLLEHFLEIFANIQTHAKTEDPIFACGQYYPKLFQLKFTLVDLGVGFLDPISKFTRGKINSPQGAIEWALIKTNSTKIDAPGGLGLSYSKDYCDYHKHGFQIITNGLCWTNDDCLVNYWSVPNFPGTVINLIFNCK
ncbi:hypothetical protein [Aquiflexum lacus]|uniref:hypothetical protein n=1 Tax=Aquiflexum lacus TaxID=2483805 RepID=UPI0018937C70|nr:hypothetical protein [Aquiflexum lacus]